MVLFKFIISTFGGGNRGTIFIVALFGATPFFQDYLKYFSFVDLGNFSFLLLAIPYLIKKEFGARPIRNPSLFENYVFIMLLIVVGFFALKKLLSVIWSYDIQGFFENSLFLRKAIFTFLLFTAITLRTKIERYLLSGFWGDVFCFYSVRFLCIALTGVALFVVWTDIKIILLSAIILLLMPPSSILPSLVSQAHAPEENVRYINTLTAILNIFYLGFLSLGFVIKMVFLS